MQELTLKMIFIIIRVGALPYWSVVGKTEDLGLISMGTKRVHWWRDELRENANHSSAKSPQWVCPLTSLVQPWSSLSWSLLFFSFFLPSIWESLRLIGVELPTNLTLFVYFTYIYVFFFACLSHFTFFLLSCPLFIVFSYVFLSSSFLPFRYLFQQFSCCGSDLLCLFRMGDSFAFRVMAVVFLLVFFPILLLILFLSFLSLPFHPSLPVFLLVRFLFSLCSPRIIPLVISSERRGDCYPFSEIQLLLVRRLQSIL